jgi:hypothetical protein
MTTCRRLPSGSTASTKGLVDDSNWVPPPAYDVTYDDDGIPYHVCGAATVELDEPLGWLYCPVCNCAVCWGAAGRPACSGP